MAVASRKTEIIITLVIDGPEAEFLRDFTQYCLDGEPAAEDLDIKIIREGIHNTIDKQLRKRK